jgi:hypothetical protein
MHENSALPPAPSTFDLTFYLICEELKTQKFFDTLSEAGIDDVYYKPRLGKAILMTMEMDDGRDETFEFYYSVIEKVLKKMDMETVTKQAVKVYKELTMEKERRKSVSPGTIK